MADLASRPVLVYVNDEFYGMMNLREEAEGRPGSGVEIEEGICSPQRCPPSVAKMHKDLDAWMHEINLQIYSANPEALMNNRKFYRDDRDGRWRPILFDVDLGFGYEPSWTNYDLFAELPRRSWWYQHHVSNLASRARWLQRLAHRLNSEWSTRDMKIVLRRAAQETAPGIDLHLSRWGRAFAEQRYFGRRALSSFYDWRVALARLLDFIERRPDIVRQQALRRPELGIKGLTQINLSWTPGGHVFVEDLLALGSDPADHAFAGTYFAGLPIRLRATPQQGFRFVRWTGVASRAPQIVIPVEDGIRAHAVFEPCVPAEECAFPQEIR